MRKLVNNQLPPILEAFVQRCSVRKLLLKISQNSPMGIELLIHNSLLNIKKDNFDVSFIVVDSKSAPILGLSTSESLHLMKRISTVKVSDEQFFLRFIIVLEK